MSLVGLLPLLGETRSSKIVQRLEQLGWGRMFSDRPPTPYLGEPWGFDNGAFACWLRGTDFSSDLFLTRMERAMEIGRPYLAVCPDLVAEGLKSLEFSF